MLHPLASVMYIFLLLDQFWKQLLTLLHSEHGHALHCKTNSDQTRWHKFFVIVAAENAKEPSAATKAAGAANDGVCV